MQVKKYKQEINIPAITKTPGELDGAEFNFKALLKEKVEKRCTSSLYVCVSGVCIPPVSIDCCKSCSLSLWKNTCKDIHGWC